MPATIARNWSKTTVTVQKRKVETGIVRIVMVQHNKAGNGKMVFTLPAWAKKITNTSKFSTIGLEEQRLLVTEHNRGLRFYSISLTLCAYRLLSCFSFLDFTDLVLLLRLSSDDTCIRMLPLDVSSRAASIELQCRNTILGAEIQKLVVHLD